MLKIIADENIPYLRGVLEPYAEIQYMGGSEIDHAAVREADALIIRTRTRCDELLLEGSRIKSIYTATIGFDHIDMEYCAKNNIEVVTAAGCNARGVLQWIGATLAIFSKNQNWSPPERTLGVIGVGNVGSLIVEYAKSWGFELLRCDPPRRHKEGGDFVSLKEIAEKCNIISFHVPLSREGENATYHMANDEFFELLKPETILINSSRGEVIETDAFIHAINDRLIYAAIDTWENEPLISEKLTDIATIATPHIAGYSAQGKANAIAIAIRAIAKKHNLSLGNWYPEGVTPSNPRPISWHELCDKIENYCDLMKETERLKKNISKFEQLRDQYNYRQEFF